MDELPEELYTEIFQYIDFERFMIITSCNRLLFKQRNPIVIKNYKNSGCTKFLLYRCAINDNDFLNYIIKIINDSHNKNEDFTAILSRYILINTSILKYINVLYLYKINKYDYSNIFYRICYNIFRGRFSHSLFMGKLRYYKILRCLKLYHKSENSDRREELMRAIGLQHIHKGYHLSHIDTNYLFEKIDLILN